jgi:NAD(P)-dependent dehydrogenase (short-subunit alcohol dehydrogenase family)
MPPTTSNDLLGRTVVVTGGNQGLGEAFAHALSAAGARVVVAARDLTRSESVAAALRASGSEAAAVPLDVTDRASVEAMLDRAIDAFGAVDVLVNNAGTCIHRPALEVTPDEWRAVMAVNLDGVWNCSQLVGAHMVARGRGSIVNIGSISAQIVNRPQMQPAYNASKAAVHHLTRSLAVEWSSAGVRVNAVAPGYVRTAMSPLDRPEFRRQWIDDVPMQRAAEPAEIAPAVVFLASDASSFMTGEVVVLDGGYTLV